VVLTGGDIDHVAGLLSLRERQAFSLYGTARTLQLLDSNILFQALSPKRVPRLRLELGEPLELLSAEGEDLGLRLTPFAVPGKVPLYAEDGSAPVAEDTVGLEISDGGKGMLAYVPGCASLSAPLIARLSKASLLFFDGTLWDDQELLRWDPEGRSARQIGHITLSGPEGSLALLGSLDRLGGNGNRRFFIHLNHTNPALLDDSLERRQVEDAGFRVACDGMSFEL
jgi:pyrroloquinoline quinone biosynthesis protein B